MKKTSRLSETNILDDLFQAGNVKWKNKKKDKGPGQKQFRSQLPHRNRKLDCCHSRQSKAETNASKFLESFRNKKNSKTTKTTKISL